MNPAPKSYLRKFKRLLKNVLQTNEFYKRKFKAAGIVSGDQINTWNEYFSLPLTTRAELIKDQQKVPPFGTNITRPLLEYSYVIRTSGTSSGVPFYQPLTPKELKRMATVMANGYKELGVKKGGVISFFTSSYAYPLFYEVSRQLGIRMVPVDDYRSTDFLNIVKAMKVTVLQSFPSALFGLIELAKNKQIDLKKLGLKKIITIGEVGGGHPPTRKFFEKTWNAKVLDHIGQLESGTLATICSKTNAYHILEKFFIVEVLKTTSKRSSTEGELVLTSLWREDYPIIRYRTGDIVKISYDSCICGKTTPRLINGILGRTTGQVKIRSLFVYSEDIERIVQKHYKGREFQIVIRKQNGEDTIDVYLEIPITEGWSGINSLLEDLEEKLGFRPQFYPLLYKTLPRFGARKGKRFHDNRKDPDNMYYPVSNNKKIASRLFAHLITWNSRKHSVQDYLSLIRNMGRK